MAREAVVLAGVVSAPLWQAWIASPAPAFGPVLPLLAVGKENRDGSPVFVSLSAFQINTYLLIKGKTGWRFADITRKMKCQHLHKHATSLVNKQM